MATTNFCITIYERQGGMMRNKKRSFINYAVNTIQSDREVTRPIAMKLDNKNNVKLYCKCRTRSVPHVLKTFLRIRRYERVRFLHSSCISETVHQTRYCPFVWHWELGNISKNSFRQDVRTRCQAVFDNEQSLHSR
jgi:hypothetical protein